MKIVPCARCGYHAPETPCPHCTGPAGPAAPTRLARNPVEELWVGAMALPRGLLLLFGTPGVKRWLLPPLVLTLATFVAVLTWTFRWFERLVAADLPRGVELDRTWAWLDARGAGWDWVRAAWSFLVTAGEWLANLGLGLLLSQPLHLLGWFLLGSLAAWYTFSIAYEALAGPFLDEVQARIEARWYGEDPRGRLERPNDIPVERCFRLSLLSATLGAAALLTVLSVPALPWWSLAPGLLLAVTPAVLLDRRYAGWLRWVASVEGRAAWASLQASLLTGLLLLLALPLYFVPVVGYLLFAVVAGFSTAVGLLDIPLSRRGWSLRQRLRFLLGHLPAILVFGTCAGLLLAVPLIGPLLMVPSASLGGLWLVCRVDKSSLRKRAIASR